MFGMFQSMVGSAVGEEMAGKLSAFIPQEAPEPPAADAPAPRWEKAMLAIKGIAQQVTKVDADGLQVFVAGDEVQEFQGIKNVKALMGICENVEPDGGLNLVPALGQALEQATEHLYAEQGSHKEQSILVVLSRKPDDADDLVDAVKEACSKLKEADDLSVTFVHVGSDPEAEEFLGFLDENLKCTSEGGEDIDIIDTLKDEDIKAAFAEFNDPGFMASGGTGALVGALAGMAAGAGGYYAYQKYQISKRTQGFNGKWNVIGYDGQKTSVHLKVRDDMEGKLNIKGYPDEEPEDFEDDEEEDDEWDNRQDCPCCQGKGYFDSWGRPCEEESMHKDLDCPCCGGEGWVDGPMTRCRRCKGKGALDTWSRPCMKNAVCYEQDCPKCEGKCFFPAADAEPEWDEEDEEPPPLWGRSTSHARYQGEKVWRFTADEEEVIPGTVEDEGTVVFEDGTRWEEKKQGVSYGKMALAGLGGAALGGAAGYVIQKKFFNKASKKVPGDYTIILDRSSAMAEMDS